MSSSWLTEVVSFSASWSSNWIRGRTMEHGIVSVSTLKSTGGSSSTASDSGEPFKNPVWIELEIRV